jgi:hypothetical protein
VENMMNVRIFQHRFDALVDTGANISAISEETLRKIQTTQKIQIHPPRVGEVKIADGAKITAIASVNIPIQSETKTIYYQDFTVFKTLAQDIILGIDFLTKNKAVLNFGKNEMTLQKPVPARLKDKVQIPPKGEMICTAELGEKRDFPNGIQGITYLPTRNLSRNFVTAKSATTVKNNLVILRIFNHTSKTLKLKKGTKVAQFEPFERETKIMPNIIANMNA